MSVCVCVLKNETKARPDDVGVCVCVCVSTTAHSKRCMLGKHQCTCHLGRQSSGAPLGLLPLPPWAPLRPDTPGAPSHTAWFGLVWAGIYSPPPKHTHTSVVAARVLLVRTLSASLT